MKKTVTLIIVIIITLGTASFVCAKTGTVTTQGLNFREEASTSSNSMMKIDKDTTVNIIGEEKEWYKITYKDKTGYVSKQYINLNNDDNTGTTTTDTNVTEEIKTVSSATIYSLPLLNSTKIQNVNNGEKVILISVVGKWAYIQTDSISGWIIASKLNSTLIKSNEEINTVPENGNSNNATNSEIQDVQTNNNVEESTNSANEQVSSNENTAKEEQTTNNDIKFPATMYVNVEAVYVRSEADKTSKAVTSVGRGTPITVIGKSGDWYKVEVSDGKGYIMGSFLSTTK